MLYIFILLITNIRIYFTKKKYMKKNKKNIEFICFCYKQFNYALSFKI